MVSNLSFKSYMINMSNKKQVSNSRNILSFWNIKLYRAHNTIDPSPRPVCSITNWNETNISGKKWAESFTFRSIGDFEVRFVNMLEQTVIKISCTKKGILNLENTFKNVQICETLLEK